MVTLPLNATDDAILNALNVWLNHVARNEYQQAFDFTYHPDGDDSTPDGLRKQIAFYGDQFNEAVWLSDSAGSTPEHCVMRSNPEAPSAKRLSGGRLLGSYESLVSAQSELESSRLGEASLQLPFGGDWSDVFATFVMIKREGQLVLILKSIYIQ